jgi:hypothetical protein
MIPSASRDHAKEKVYENLQIDVFWTFVHVAN